MIENILTQEVSYAKITPFKNYSNINIEKNINGKNDVIGLFYLKNKIVYLYPPFKRKLDYFYSDSGEGGRPYENVWIKPSRYNDDDYGYRTFYTTSEKHIRNHYGNPLSQIIVNRVIRTITKIDDKVTFKIYRLTKTRGVNKLFFKKYKHITSLTLDLKTGNFKIFDLNNNKKTFTTNTFSDLSAFSFFPVNLDNIKDTKFIDEIKNVFDNVEYTNTIKNVLNITSTVVNYGESYDEFTKDFCDVFMNLKKIKKPNDNYQSFLMNYYPTEKFLKKNDRKLVSSMLDMFNYKSKINIKILHKYPFINLGVFLRVCSFFGDDYQKYIGNIDEKIFMENNKPSKVVQSKKEILNINRTEFDISDDEKENLVKIINNTNNTFTDDMLTLFIDHFSMIKKLRDYNLKLSLNAKSFDEFNKEHDEFSKIHNKIKKGWEIQYQFSENMTKSVEEPIEHEFTNHETNENVTVTYYPHILKTESDYIEEGEFMHHCVATYVEKNTSIIVSLRTEDSSDRVTCEYELQNGRLLQCRHFCNNEPPADMRFIIDNFLTNKIKKFAKLGLLHPSTTIRVPIKINGIEIVNKEPSVPVNPYAQ